MHKNGVERLLSLHTSNEDRLVHCVPYALNKGGSRENVTSNLFLANGRIDLSRGMVRSSRTHRRSDTVKYYCTEFLTSGRDFCRNIYLIWSCRCLCLSPENRDTQGRVLWWKRQSVGQYHEEREILFSMLWVDSAALRYVLKGYGRSTELLSFVSGHFSWGC